MAKTLSELTNDVKFKADWRTLDRVKSRMKQLDKDGGKLRKSLAKPLKMRMDSGGLNKAKSQLTGLEKSASKLRGRLSKPFRVSIDGGALKSVQHQMRATEASVGSLRGRLLALATGFGGGAILAGAAKGLFDTNVELAKLKGALKTATGSTSAANAKFAELQRFGAQTPFTLDQSIQAFIKLKNMGLNPTERALRSYGNTSSAMSKSMMDMIEAVSDAATGEFERLKEFGIKAKSEGDMVEFTFQKVKTKVKKDAASIEEYLIKLGETKFGASMKDQMQALPGVVSNVEDAFQALQLAIGEGGMNAALLPILKEIGTALSGIDGAAIGKALGGAITFIANAAKGAVSAIQLLSAKVGGFGNLAKIVGAALAFMMAPLIGGAIVSTVTAVMGLGAALSGLSLAGVGSAIAAFLLNPLTGLPILIGAVVVAVGLLAYDIYQFATGGSSVIGSLAAKFPLVGQVVKAIGDAFKSVLPSLQNFGAKFMTLLPPLISIGQSLGLVLFSAFTAIMPAIVAVATALWQVLGAIMQIVFAVLSLAVQIIAAFLNVAAFIAQWVAITLALVFAFVGGAIGAFVGMVAAVIAGFSRMVAAIVGFLAALLSGIISFVTSAITFLVQLWTQPTQAARNFGAAVIGVVNQIRAAFAGLGGAIVAAFSGAIATVKGIISSLSGSVSSIINQIRGASSAAGKISMGLPGGGRGVFSPNFHNGGNTFNIYDGDATRVGALMDRSMQAGTRSQISDFARGLNIMVPGLG